MSDAVQKPDVADGQAVYSRRVLSVYDLWVLGLSNRFIWRCPTSHLLTFHNQHVTGNHLDVGVGTGYYLDKCHFQTGPERVVLMDLNQNSLHYAAKRIRRYRPVPVRHNVLEPFPEDCNGFDSVSLNYLVHCLPGPMQDKAVVFQHCRKAVKIGGTVFGTTIISDPQHHSRTAARLMAVYNRKGIFGNQTDTIQSLDAALRTAFTDPQITVRGCVAMFHATKH